MDLPITYLPNFVDNPTETFRALWDDLTWRRIGETPRREYYCNDFEHPYPYGRGAGVRTYESQPYHSDILALRHKLEDLTNTAFEVVFLNGYDDARDALGWHDDSPEMDDERPIGIISLGAEREIWFSPQSDVKSPSKRTELKLGNGSLCLMHPGMQDTHFHRIPKASFVCGPRLSLTFRGYVDLSSAEGLTE